MMKLSLVVVVLSALAVALAAPRVPQRALVHQIQRGVAGPNPYIFLTVPKGRSQSLLQAFEVLEDNDEEERYNVAEDNADDDDDDDANDAEEINDDDDEEENAKDSVDKMVLAEEQSENTEDDDDDELDNVMSMNLKLRKTNAQIHNAKPTQMMITREHAGAILVPDEVIEIEGQNVIDEKTGKPALLLPRAILDAIPDGSVVALMERSSDSDDDKQAEERANRVIVRRRRKGARRNIRRRRGNKRRVNRRGVNNRRRVNKRRNVRVIRRGGNKRRGVNRRRVNRRRVSLQGY